MFNCSGFSPRNESDRFSLGWKSDIIIKGDFLFAETGRSLRPCHINEGGKKIGNISRSGAWTFFTSLDNGRLTIVLALGDASELS